MFTCFFFITGSGCQKTIENGRLINCQSNIGESCLYECNEPFEINPLVINVTCDSNGNWDKNTGELCGKRNERLVYLYLIETNTNKISTTSLKPEDFKMNYFQSRYAHQRYKTDNSLRIA